MKKPKRRKSDKHDARISRAPKKEVGKWAKARRIKRLRVELTPLRKKRRPRPRAIAQRARFLEALAETRSVTRACKAAGINRDTAYRWKKESRKFARQWREALLPKKNNDVATESQKSPVADVVHTSEPASIENNAETMAGTVLQDFVAGLLSPLKAEPTKPQKIEQPPPDPKVAEIIRGMEEADEFSRRANMRGPGFEPDPRLHPSQRSTRSMSQLPTHALTARRRPR